MFPLFTPRSALQLLALTGGLIAGIAQANTYGDVTHLMQKGGHIEAIAKADQYLRDNPGDPQMRFLRGIAQSNLGNLQEAEATFQSITEDYPELPEPYNNLAVIYASQNQLDKAREALERAVRNNPNYAIAHENLGDIYARLAHTSYKRSLQLNEKNRPLQLKLSTLTSMLQPSQQ